jgi:hypothetical protein
MLDERRTIARMIGIYCHSKHGTRKILCQSCKELLDYAELRLSRCPFAPEKPVCGKCPVHCYQSEKRESVREVMRFAGPRMILADPVAALKHLVALRRKPSPAVKRATARRANQIEAERGENA